jgi:hypothetical protein
MPASPDQIKATIVEFISLIERESISPENRLLRLRRSLDQLALLQHDVSYACDDRDYPDTPCKDYQKLRELVSSRFPDLGHYNVPALVTQHIAEAEMHVGDATDDITDIALDLYDVQWRLENTSVDDALWYFTNSYFTHWEEHLRGLQLYLQRLAAGHEETNASNRPPPKS